MLLTRGHQLLLAIFLKDTIGGYSLNTMVTMANKFRLMVNDIPMANNGDLDGFNYLVGGFKHEWIIVHFIYGIYNPLPIDELIFFRGLKLPTRLYFALLMVNIPLIILINTVSHGINYQLKNIHLLQGIFSWPWNKPNYFHTHPLHQLAHQSREHEPVIKSNDW
jgi:hypothetical protein